MDGVGSTELKDLLYFQLFRRQSPYTQQVLDYDHNGRLWVQEASENPVFSTLTRNLTLLLTQNVTTANGTTAEQLNPQYNKNNDTFISINDELKPRLIDGLNSLSVVTPGERVS